MSLVDLTLIAIDYWESAEPPLLPTSKANE